METESVTVKVPANLLRLLEEKNYFGKPKDEWYINCVRQGIDGELNELSDIKEIRRLEKEYNIPQKNNDEQAEHIETVDRSITIKVPKEFDDFLQVLTKANGTTVEKYFVEELYGVLCSFYEGGHWDHYLEPLGKRLEKLADQVWQEI